MSLKHPIIKSFPFAINGLRLALTSEPNLRIHFIIGSLAVILGLFLKFTPTELALLFLTIGVVIILELINTLLEALVDLVSPEIQEKARTAKDVSAAAVLISAILSLVVGGLLFLPKILELLKAR